MLGDIELRNVPVRDIQLVVNPDDSEGTKDCWNLLMSLNEDPETKSAGVRFRTAKIVSTGEDDIIVNPGSILVELRYTDNYTSYTLLCREEEE